MSKLAGIITDFASGESRRSEYYMFEPWDVGRRPQSVIDQIKEDMVTEKVQSYGSDPHLFQSGIIYEYPRIAAIFAGTQVGKSYPVLVDIIAQSTGELPHALKFPKGEKTGVKREITKENINRFGRFDAETGEYLDRNAKAEEDGTWDCGEIIGAGVYPKDKILKDGDVIWLGTFKQARDENWWRKLKAMIPEHCLDKSHGTDGFSNSQFHVYLNTGVEIHIITYEQGYERFESVEVARCVLDEEPPSEKIFSAALNHCKQLTLVETPYRGVTYTYSDIKLAAEKDEDETIKFYHCIQYDCPFKTGKEIRQKRLVLPKWEIESRVYGLHSEQVGKPYFHDLYDEIQEWKSNFKNTGKRYNIEFVNPCNARRAAEINPILFENSEGMWEIYEAKRGDAVYWLSADTAQGDEGGDERVDANVAHIFRLPLGEESREFPIEVACCRTTLNTKLFARECIAAASHFNNALIAPEAKGFSAGTFINEIHDYPFIYTMTVTDDRTKRQKEQLGFNTNVKTRQQLFDEIGDKIRYCAEDTDSPFRSYSTLDEISKLITGKNGRPDHGKNSTTDSIISYAIGLYIYRFDSYQVKDNTNFKKNLGKKVDTWGGRFVKENGRETRPVLGSMRGLDGRQHR